MIFASESWINGRSPRDDGRSSDRQESHLCHFGKNLNQDVAFLLATESGLGRHKRLEIKFKVDRLALQESSGVRKHACNWHHRAEKCPWILIPRNWDPKIKLDYLPFYNLIDEEVLEGLGDVNLGHVLWHLLVIDAHQLCNLGWYCS